VILIGQDVRDEILEALESVANHDAALSVETIFVDNASTDGSPQLVTERFPETIVIRLPVNEQGAARNHAMRIARGRYLMFLDSDAQLIDGALEELVRFLDEHPGFGMVGPRLLYEDGQLQYSARRYPPFNLPLLRRPPMKRFFEHTRTVRRHMMMDVPLHEPREVEYMIGACLLFSADAGRQVGAIDPKIFFPMEDVDWCLSIRSAGYRIAYDPHATVVHTYRRKTAQSPLSRAALQHLWGFVRLHWKWRRQRRRLLSEGEEIDRRQGRLD
jgi:N-acetylglucosaminyl-diphospho-decaprenol L-rhamnosyltransferase